MPDCKEYSGIDRAELNLLRKDLAKESVHVPEGDDVIVKGRVRGDLGDATDNTSEHIKGRAEELEGKIQKNFGKAERKSDPDNM